MLAKHNVKIPWWVDDSRHENRPFPFDPLSFAPYGYDPRYITPIPLCSCRGPSLQDRYLISNLLASYPNWYQEWRMNPSIIPHIKRTMRCECGINYNDIVKKIHNVIRSDEPLDRIKLYSLLSIHTGYYLTWNISKVALN